MKNVPASIRSFMPGRLAPSRRASCRFRAGGALLWALLAGGLLFGSGGGCERTAATSRKIVLTLAMPASGDDEKIYQQTLDRFEAAHPDIHVRLLPVPGNYYQKVLVMIAGGHAPDLMWMGEGFAEFAGRDVFLDLSGRIARDIDPNSFFPHVLDWYRIKGKQYTIPFGIDLKFMAYNKSLFDAAGLPYPHNDWNYDEFLTDVTQLTKDLDGDGHTDQFGYCGELDPSLFGAQFVASDGSRATCDSPQMLECLRTNLDLYVKCQVAIPPKKTLDESLTAFRQGKIAILQVATWDRPFLHDRLADMQWDIVCNPKVTQRGHWASSQAIVVSADTPHPEEAWMLCQEFFSPEFQKAMSFVILPAGRSVAEQMVAANHEAPANLQALLVAAQSLYASPRIARLNEMQQFFNDARERIWLQRATPAEAMALCERQIDRVIAEARRDSQ